MKNKKPFKVFQTFALTFFFVCMAILGMIVVKAFSRRSGSTGLDMAKVQQLRYHSAK